MLPSHVSISELKANFLRKFLYFEKVFLCELRTVDVLFQTPALVLQILTFFSERAGCLFWQAHIKISEKIMMLSSNSSLLHPKLNLLK